MRLLFSLLFLISMNPVGASTVDCSGSMLPPLAINLSPRQQLIKTYLIGNVMMPQAGQGFSFMVFTLIIRNPGWIDELFAETSAEDVQMAERMMNRAHAAYGINYRTEGHPDAKPGYIVTPARLANLIDAAKRSAVQSLIFLAHRLEPKDKVWLQRNAFEFKSEEGLLLAHDLKEFLNRHRIDEPGSLLNGYRQVLAAVTEGQEMRDFSKRYREAIAATVASRSPRQADQAHWEFKLYSFLLETFQKKTRELLPTEQTDQVKALFFWGLGD